MNKPCVHFKGIGLVQVNDEPFYFLTDLPRRIGDDAIIMCKGKEVFVRLLRSYGMRRCITYLVAR